MSEGTHFGRLLVMSFTALCCTLHSVVSRVGTALAASLHGVLSCTKPIAALQMKPAAGDWTAWQERNDRDRLSTL